MYYFRQTIGDRLLNSTVTGNPDILSYASSYTSGQYAVMLVNKGTASPVVQVNIKNALTGSRFYWYTLTGGSDNGEFSRKVFVNGEGPDVASGGPTDYSSLKAYAATTNNGIKITMPSRSVVYLIIDK
ncbi:MAG: hypothetical protein ACRDE8_11970 [Ginsengibacter sp.]